MTFAQTIVTASDCVGFILPGIIEDPGSFEGKISSPYPALGPEPKNLISFAILVKDTAKVLSEYVDIVMLRTASHDNLEEFGKYLEIPIINGLSDQSHPCQIISDILTFEEIKGNIENRTISWLGDGNNNMSNSLIEAA